MEQDIKSVVEKEECSADATRRGVMPAPVFLPPVEMRAHVAELHRQRRLRLMKERDGRDGTDRCGARSV